MIELIISLASGALGGNVAGKVLKNFDQGTLVNSVLGILGGGVGGSILSSLTGGAVTDEAGPLGEVETDV